jgi:DNA-binding PadR family transcriptional regulator
MGKPKPNPIDALLPLPLPVFHMLLALTEGERHGYAGKLNLASGALYGSINKVLEQGLIEESEERPDRHLDDERRRYYRITPLGLRVAQAEAARLRALVELAEGSLGFPETA